MTHDVVSGHHHGGSIAPYDGSRLVPDGSAPAGWPWARLVIAACSRVMAEIERSPGFQPIRRSPGDAVVGFSLVATRTAVGAGRMVGRVMAPVGGFLLAPPLVNPRWQPATVVRRLSDLGHRERVRGALELELLTRQVVPRVVEAVLDQMDLTELVSARVDLDAVVARVDLDAAVARVDLDAIVSRIDVDGIVAAVDLDAVAARIDVDAVAARLDIEQVISRVDLLGLAQYVVEGIDLPEIIRDSTGSIASEAVRGVRMQSIEADAQVARLIDRFVRRGRSRSTSAPSEPNGIGDIPVQRDEPDGDAVADAARAEETSELP